MKKLVFPLLGAMVLSLFVSAAADTQSDTQEDKTFPENEGILQLHKGNFKMVLRKHKQLLVHFYTPLTSEGQRVAAAFEAAGAELQGSEVKLAVIDVTKEKELAKKLNVSSQPTIRLYLAGDINSPASCPVPQSSASILIWLQRRAGSPADLIIDLSQLEASDDLTVVGFFKELNHDYVQVFYATAIDLPDVRFAVIQNDEDFGKYSATQDIVLLLKKVLIGQIIHH
ncbi:protein disulfide-isomerase-like [Cyprinodon tularosa]|uniref:protein disulfide-isomerase-like n=1 Tax=Cyprinodon tularosa TaxID=77115 RepID=UPI0018E24339|nr:protein disulfide-isomerase-like [Cyprinodon tularosa]